MQIGEGFAGGGANAAHVNTVLGPKDGPVAAASTAALLATPRLGHTPFVVVVRPNVPVKPFTLFVNKSAVDTEKNERHARLTWGAAQAGIAAGVMATLRTSDVQAESSDLLLIAAVWVDPSADDEEPCSPTTKQRPSPPCSTAVTAPPPWSRCSRRAIREPVLPLVSITPEQAAHEMREAIVSVPARVMTDRRVHVRVRRRARLRGDGLLLRRPRRRARRRWRRRRHRRARVLRPETVQTSWERSAPVMTRRQAAQAWAGVFAASALDICPRIATGRRAPSCWVA